MVPYLSHVCAVFALGCKLIYESVNMLVNRRFLFLQSTTAKGWSKHLADNTVCLRIWVSGNASVLSLDTLDLLSLDKGRGISRKAGQEDICRNIIWSEAVQTIF